MDIEDETESRKKLDEQKKAPSSSCGVVPQIMEEIVKVIQLA